MRDTLSATVYWAANDVNAQGQVIDESLGNGLVTQRAFNPANGLVDTIQTWNGLTAVQDDGFNFDKLGNLTRRIDAIQGRQEDFTYDGINRLTEGTLLDSGTLVELNTNTYGYDSVGNLISKTDVGAYVYRGVGTGPHAVTGVSGGPAGNLSYAYDANGNMTSGAGRTLNWSSYNKPVYIDGGAVLTFDYGPDRARIRQVATTGSSVKTIKYVGSLYEKRVTGSNPAELVHYIRAAGTVAIYTQIDDADPLTDKTRYLHRDHLGSIVAITDEAGVVTEQLSFDAHGKRRATDWQAAIFPPSPVETPRGFTGHEHLDGVDLIHMNGRVYDPLLGRFLSADPTVQFPKSTQGLNRYTYVNNNPLSFTDPSGFGFFSKIFRSIGKAIKAVKKVVSKALSNQFVRIGIAIAAVAFLQPEIVGLIAANAAGAAVAAGASFAGVVTAYGTAATAVSTSIISGAVSGFVGGLIVSGGDLKAAGIGALTGGALGFVGASSAFGGSLAPQRIAAHGLIGGARSVLQGGKFSTGFLTGAISKTATPFSKAITQGNVFATAVAQAAVGGTTSVIGGGKFGNGAVTAAYGYLLNDVIQLKANIMTSTKIGRLLFGDDFIGQGGSASLAISFPGFFGGRFDAGVVGQINGGGQNYGIGKSGIGLEYNAGEINDLSGRGVQYNIGTPIGGATVQLDSENQIDGLGLQAGPGFYFGDIILDVPKVDSHI